MSSKTFGIISAIAVVLAIPFIIIKPFISIVIMLIMLIIFIVGVFISLPDYEKPINSKSKKCNLFIPVNSKSKKCNLFIPVNSKSKKCNLFIPVFFLSGYKLPREKNKETEKQKKLNYRTACMQKLNNQAEDIDYEDVTDVKYLKNFIKSRKPQ